MNLCCVTLWCPAYVISKKPYLTACRCSMLTEPCPDSPVRLAEVPHCNHISHRFFYHLYSCHPRVSHCTTGDKHLSLWVWFPLFHPDGAEESTVLCSPAPLIFQLRRTAARTCGTEAVKFVSVSAVTEGFWPWQDLLLLSQPSLCKRRHWPAKCLSFRPALYSPVDVCSIWICSTYRERVIHQGTA